MDIEKRIYNNIKYKFIRILYFLFYEFLAFQDMNNIINSKNAAINCNIRQLRKQHVFSATPLLDSPVG